MFAAVLVSASYAYETDQLTGRDRPLADADAFADAIVQEAIDRAVAETNERLRCRSTPEEAVERFVERFADDVSNSVRVPGRGLSRGFGYDLVGAALERGPIDRLTFDGDADTVFARLSFLDSPVLDTAGICSTIALSGIRIGTDKVDHFLVTGHHAWERRARGRDPVSTASGSERSTLGWWTSDAYSYADLAADLDGVAFYDGLAAPGGYVAVGDDGCLRSVRPFHWSEWVKPTWDEVENPSVYQPRVQEAIDDWLDDHQGEVCAAYGRWADPHYPSRLAAALATTVPKGIPRVDPFRLPERCAAGSGERAVQ